MSWLLALGHLSDSLQPLLRFCSQAKSSMGDSGPKRPHKHKDPETMISGISSYCALQSHTHAIKLGNPEWETMRMQTALSLNAVSSGCFSVSSWCSV